MDGVVWSRVVCARRRHPSLRLVLLPRNNELTRVNVIDQSWTRLNPFGSPLCPARMLDNRARDGTESAASGIREKHTRHQRLICAFSIESLIPPRQTMWT